jgi:hypothetical protein
VPVQKPVPPVMENKMNTLSINAYLKYIEYLLHVLDASENSKSVGEIKNDFASKFDTTLVVFQAKWHKN